MRLRPRCKNGYLPPWRYAHRIRIAQKPYRIGWRKMLLHHRGQSPDMPLSQRDFVSRPYKDTYFHTGIAKSVDIVCQSTHDTIPLDSYRTICERTFEPFGKEKTAHRRLSRFCKNMKCWFLCSVHRHQYTRHPKTLSNSFMIQNFQASTKYSIRAIFSVSSITGDSFESTLVFLSVPSFDA